MNNSQLSSDNGQFLDNLMDLLEVLVDDLSILDDLSLNWLSMETSVVI